MSETEETRFDALNLPAKLQAGVNSAGFEVCTPIQAQTLPRALKGHDVAGQAQTGTGKTAAFLLATLNHLLANADGNDDCRQHPRAIILAPTRELAIQINEDAKVLGSGTKFRFQVVFGGADYEKQRRRLEEGVDVLIGTPGRFIDYFKQNIFNLKNVEVVVLDEADRMFDLGFIKDIRYVLRRLPPADKRLNLLFSATLSQKVLELAFEHMNDPESVRIDPDKMTVDLVTQAVYFPSNREKIPLLIGLLRSMNAHRTMVFVNTKREAEKLERFLCHNDIDAKAISGDVPQNKRIRMLKAFQSGELPVLVATDVASRGLHIPDVSHVINYDVPQDPEDYVHRIGRTARAGATGDSITFACESFAMGLPDVEKYIGHSIPVKSLEPELLVKIRIPPAPPRKPGRGGRPGNRSGGNSQKQGGRRRHR
ncbi:MAG: RNA helicase [Chromatiales bacterium]|jgi:ATP-dependent RNA helicase RhlB|nr:RNA helicase [Chromatiales bacterium]MDP6150381.1 DEAD/DEAH box helicase [Gammaproteobacteria bacterium]MDP7093701.1 DEAD/DEAH box helicase [Gammaproteobacteria bacterium]MDP7270327.1 DEAD/DEAH box helicase [Gammaproteobacteria bacterium]HJP05235.1 DEAD/DEAH box helicase [Gammaproteobacteria bacterium]